MKPRQKNNTLNLKFICSVLMKNIDEIGIEKLNRPTPNTDSSGKPNDLIAIV